MKAVNLDLVRKDINQALKPVEEKHGIEFSLGTMRYDDSSFRATLEASLSVIDGKSKEQHDFETQCVLFGIKPEDYLARIKVGSNICEIYGFNLRAKSMPVRVRSIYDKEVCYKISAVSATVKLKNRVA